MRKIKVDGHRNLYRDQETGAIINCDVDSYNSYVKSRDARKSQKKEIEELKNEIDELKKLLRQILDK